MRKEEEVMRRGCHVFRVAETSRLVVVFGRKRRKIKGAIGVNGGRQVAILGVFAFSEGSKKRVVSSELLNFLGVVLVEKKGTNVGFFWC